ncbi:Cell division protein FtsQ [Roseovarius sp. EC-HK134]|jgi:cell division protein FtsQ|uniref:cell division protein FtsQ/DivIB n=1 Tax=Roseovarius TaxID=74030 RepID=UPI0001556C2C|nr:MULTISPECIES: cell division protein FtsQ/DivIB [Roseovarius]AWZ22598.1 Cell division protein FtsQ [Roseovarius sp. AK1035]EDM32328.1 cell division protein ftsQ [Roseovarius sp. TM1035]MBW4973765.1 cell division protein FtsQ/DivIB [Roseovarius mucosus]VVT33360.1 Cell division protein FtsQ [Roseovarius sp. EC-SD190]VVT33503.1 Cell division protein FtsQ [Roseovarius sp. EC-HK134]|tara:strand:+ start:429 stop:1298 length:870 start_codon:yes stop_codon:yes gene_type:complete
MQPVIPRADPAPSRMSYRLQRLMLTPLYRRLIRFGLPILVVAGIAGGYLSSETRRTALVEQVAEIRHQIETRPEFMVNLLSVEGASTSVQEDIREIFPYDLPASSFDLVLDDIRVMIEELPAVARAEVRIRQGGVLVAEITERVPVALWKTRDALNVIDIEGQVIGVVKARAERADLPVVAGDGAPDQVAEAIELLRAAVPLGMDLRGLVRMGERRWDLVLADGKRILLPETGAVRALERVIVLHGAQDMLGRDLASVDMRIAARPTIRLNENAMEDWWTITQMSLGTN